MKTERVNKIENASYEGYYWMSDQEKPELVSNRLPDTLVELISNSNPFVIEAQLYSDKAKLSYSVKYVDGDYYIIRTELDGEDIEAARKGMRQNLTYNVFYAQRMGGRKLCFIQYWEATEDAFCENMNVLQPAQSVFVGFEK